MWSMGCIVEIHLAADQQVRKRRTRRRRACHNKTTQTSGAK